MDLDELLTSATPPVTTRTPELERELTHLVAASEPAATHRRWPARAAVVGGALAGVLGVGAVASATGVLPGWPDFSTSSGQTCRIEIIASELAPGEGEYLAGVPLRDSFSATEREQTLAAAQAFLADYDYDAVDRDEAVASWRADEAEARTAQPDRDERQPRLSGDDLEVTAVSYLVVQELRAGLAAQGLDIRAVAVTTSTSGCDL